MSYPPPVAHPWTFDPRAYTDTLVATVHVSIGGVPQTAGVLAAFVDGDETARAAQASTLVIPIGPYAGKVGFSLVVYGESADAGKPLLFKFQDSAGIIINLQASASFAPNAILGSALAPLMATGDYSPPPSTPPPPSPPPPPPPPPVIPPPSSPSTVVLTIRLNSGWTWISVNVETNDMGLNAIFASVSIPMGSADYVKSQDAFAQYYPGFGFFGSMNSVTTNTMYKIYKVADSTFSVTGTPVVLPMAMQFSSGWNYLPCPYQTQTTLTQAFPASGPSAHTWQTSDLIKSQMMFSTYYEGFGWFGNLQSIMPGEGYKMKLNTAGDAAFPAA